ncbi:hypothetical protein M3G91_23545 [Micromonospora chalcea]|uniref:hypothetical protein n=1 Tax=Micromonospora chalcea TaxID=1874 RepID=UPI0021A6C6DD|nr:hypothetical protein [Micromonospora chalcea]MCT2280594.1 hypothetical protein [Micromonospora chalcea]
MKIEKRTRGRNHSYYDLDTGSRIDGVTTINGNGLPKPALINWAGDATAEYAVDNWDELSKLAPSERLKKIKGGRYEKRDAAAAKGSTIHKLAERLIAGERVTIPDGLEGYVRSAVRFLDEFTVRAVHVEAVVYSESRRHVGTLDLIADVLLPDMPEFDHIRRDDDGFSRGLFDWKTGRSGIFGDVALQLAPYRWSEYLVLPGGEVIDMPEVDFCAGIHLRADGYDCRPLECGEDTYRDFLYVKEVARIVDGLRDLVGESIVPPTASQYVLTVAGSEGPDGMEP